MKSHDKLLRKVKRQIKAEVKRRLPGALSVRVLGGGVVDAKFPNSLGPVLVARWIVVDGGYKLSNKRW